MSVRPDTGDAELDQALADLIKAEGIGTTYGVRKYTDHAAVLVDEGLAIKLERRATGGWHETKRVDERTVKTSTLRAALAALLAEIEAADTDYDRRYGLVLRAVALADQAGYAVGFRVDNTEPDFPVAYIELPTGQVSWHMPKHRNPWDGHTTAAKYERCRAYADIAQ